MNLASSLPPESILVGVRAANKWDLMEQMLDHIITQLAPVHRKHLDRQEVWQLLREREERQSTGIGEGFAIPHVRLPAFRSLAMCLATLDEGIDFESIDGQPVHLACMVLTSLDEPMLALKVMSKWSTIVAAEQQRSALKAATSPEDVYAILNAEALDLDLVVCAEDLMIPPPFTVLPDMPIAEVTHQMMLHHTASIPVQDAEGRMLGAITSDLLFQYGMPDFFQQLQSVSFLRNFNPLDKLYEIEKTVTAGELMSRDYAEVGRKHTLMEVIFELSVKQHPMVYVTENEKLIGIIGRMTVLDRAINF